MEDLFGDEKSPQTRGGLARAAVLSPEERSQIARVAARRRWDTDQAVLRATHGSGDRPLVIGDLEIPCYVLEDGRRVLSLGGMVQSLGMSIGGGRAQGDRLLRFVSQQRLNPFVSNDLIGRMKEPIRFRSPSGGTTASGYEATILPEICDAVLDARAAKGLRRDQAHIAQKCEILVRAFARVGIIALVDEATGYQEIRDRQALEDILNKYISEELRKWTLTFPDEYFLGIMKLKGWKVPEKKGARPGIIAHHTNDIVYGRLAPGVLRELQGRNPTDGKGRRKHKHHQYLTSDHGHPKLREHLEKVTLLMAASATWQEFRKLLDRVLPPVNVPGELPLNAPPDEPDA